MLRLEPHAGDFGTGQWVMCAAPCCGTLHQGQGWYAIPKGTPHYFDRRLHRHLHLDCGDTLIAAGLAERVDVAASDPVEVLRRG